LIFFQLFAGANLDDYDEDLDDRRLHNVVYHLDDVHFDQGI
jgi:hypothetical protein